MKTAFLTILAATGLLISSCTEADGGPVQGFAPVYGTVDDLSSLVVNSSDQLLEKPGKIYVKGNRLYINEVLKGVHVYDNSDPSDPLKMTFINIPGNQDIVIRGNYVYADYLSGLLTLDISDVYNVKVMDFQTGLKGINNGQIAPPNSLYSDRNNNIIYFECADPEKGIVIDWVEKEMPQPECYVQN